ncbi:hemerythrin domain-containing protein [Agromyces cerinus]|uniref:Hemerythrin HHE cation binding domain-containing protein n=1 Tax=Agromyces cerinus subsp. cerinus TaxID=232089 RepID=A0A1N6DSK5_9MICO|nr:hemerythrin domain-containing protein [Agromyces cerinus]SIN73772.1 Hemerythrin HHE cation binding domain-containing protein [Agromyces cerinus subsp. cerinus]
MTTRLPSTGASAAGGAPATTCRSDEIVLIHRIFRRLFGEAPGLVREVVPGDAKRIAFLTQHLHGLTALLHTHHHAEDDFFWDRMTERAPACGLHVALMRTQHQTVSDQLDEIDALIDVWAASNADASDAERLARALDEVDRTLAVHLADEEREALPVLDAVLSEAEWDEISAHAQREKPPLPLFLLLGLMMEAVPESERSAWMARELPAPMRAAYRLFGRRGYERALRRLHPVPEKRVAGERR